MFENIPLSELVMLGGSLIITGAIAGFLSGLLGVGGGAIMVPILYQLFHFIGVEESVRMHLAVGTSLAVIVPTSMRSFKGHLDKGKVDRELLKEWIIPVVLGASFGSLISGVLSSNFLRAVFAVISFLLAIKLGFNNPNWRLGDDLPQGWVRKILGATIGTLSSWMGIGGGILGGSLMTTYGRPIHQAIATSSGLGVLIAIPATIGYMIAGWGKVDQLPPLSLGYVSLIGVGLLISTSILAAPFGVRVAHGLEKRKLEIAFAIFLFCVSLRFIISLW